MSTERTIGSVPGEAADEQPWTSLLMGAAALVLGLLPLIAATVRALVTSPETGILAPDAAVTLAYHPIGTQLGMLVMTAVFAAVGLQLWRRRRGPLAARPALFVVAVGLGLLVATSLWRLLQDFDVASGHVKSAQMLMLWLFAAVMMAGLLLAALAFALLNSADPVKFAVGVGLAFLPAVHWLHVLFQAVLGDLAWELGRLVPLTVAALVGVTLGLLGRATPGRRRAWVLVVAIMVLGAVALQVAYFVISGQPDHGWLVVRMALLGSLVHAAVAVGAGLLVMVVRGRRAPQPGGVEHVDDALRLH